VPSLAVHRLVRRQPPWLADELRRHEALRGDLPAARRPAPGHRAPGRNGLQPAPAKPARQRTMGPQAVIDWDGCVLPLVRPSPERGRQRRREGPAGFRLCHGGAIAGTPRKDWPLPQNVLDEVLPCNSSGKAQLAQGATARLSPTSPGDEAPDTYTYDPGQADAGAVPPAATSTGQPTRAKAAAGDEVPRLHDARR